MIKLDYQGKSYQCRDEETVLQAFMRHGVTVPFSCGNGICHVCLRRCEKGDIPADAQKGLRETLKSLGYFLICKCIPTGNMTITPPRDADLFNRAVVYKKEILAPDICRLLLEPATQLYYHAGQFINIRNQSGVTRSYSLSSVPREDYFLELHIKRVTDGTMSNWIFDELQENEELEFQGPTGKNYYTQGDLEQPMLLVGTGTGASPLTGIARDALLSGHTGPVHLYHGSRHERGLYLQDSLNELANKHENFFPVFCVSGSDVPEKFRPGRANEVAFNNHRNLKGWKIYLCGQPEMVETAMHASLAAGASEFDIHTDPFSGLVSSSAENVLVNDAPESISTDHVQLAERRKYPQPDLELWQALEEGRILFDVLKDFYSRVYEDPLLSSFFEGVTRQRAIEKQYNFLCQVITGENVYFGERPRNAHHWMVISDELFDYRESLMESCLRHNRVPEQFIRRFRAIEEIYREDIVKDKPWNKVLFGKEVPYEGFEKMTLDDATLCDACEQEIPSGASVQYHVRLGKVYCNACQQD